MAATSRKFGGSQEFPGQVNENFQSRPQAPSSSRLDSSLEDIVKSLALNTQQFQMSTQQFQNETRSSIQSLESQVSKLETSMSKLESQGKLPSQTEMNPRQNVSAITLRSGKELEEPIRKRDRGHGLNGETEPETELVMKKLTEGVQNEEKSSPLDGIVIKPPVPERLVQLKKKSEEKDMMEDGNSEKHCDILLGSPFLSTTKTKIDVYEGTFSMEFDGEVVKFNAMKRPNEISSVCKVGVINPIVQESLELHQQCKLSNMLSESIDQGCLEKLKENLDSDEVQEEVVYEQEALKPKLVQVKEGKLVQMHGEYKEAIAYVKDLSLLTCMQRIPLGVNYDPIQEVQRHFNPPRMEVFKNEFQKLLDANMIYLKSELSLP
ncbi:DNA-directed DNA polymerase [Senna tora]|uniref:DNA-directed DNA polymerase n=1 Tax=Senna tora TaxID=362788 RepID=A0A834SZV7_9FABA|nr:DNA-directed DNA polymerase [Senna tora]